MWKLTSNRSIAAMIRSWNSVFIVSVTLLMSSSPAVEGKFIADFCNSCTSKCFALFDDTKKYSWDAGSTVCVTERNGTLAAILNSDEQTDLQENIVHRLSRDGDNRAWLGGRENTSNDWYWLDGTKYEDSLNMDESNYHTCALIRRVGKLKIESNECRELLKGYICKRSEDALGCREGGLEFEWHSTRHCLYYEKSSITWYQAYMKCIEHGSESLSVMKGFMSNNQPIDPQNLTAIYSHLAWIGLRRRRWQWTSLHQSKAAISFAYTNWEAGEPDDKGHRCAIIDINTGKWSDGDCSKSLHSFVCQYNTERAQCTPPTSADSSRRSVAPTTVDTTVMSSSQKDTNPLGKDKYIIIGVLVPLVGILVIVIAVLVFVLRRRSKRIAREQSNRTSKYATAPQYQPSTDYANALPGEAESQHQSYDNSPSEFGTASTDSIVSDYAEIGNLPDITHRGPTPRGQTQVNATVTGTEEPHSPLVIKPPIATKPTDASPYSTISEPRIEPDETPGPSTTALRRSPSKMERFGKAFQRVKSKLPNIRRTDPPNTAPRKTLTKPASGNLRIEHTGAFGQTATLDENHKVAPQTGDIYAQVVKSNRSSELELRENPLYGTGDDL